MPKEFLMLRILFCFIIIFPKLGLAIFHFRPINYDHLTIESNDKLDEETNFPLGDLSTVGILLEKNDKTKTVCTGVIIAPRIILSAAHCTTETKNAQIYFDQIKKSDYFFNSLKIKSSNVLRWIPHPDYKGNQEDSIDLGIFILKKNIEENKNIKFARFYPEHYQFNFYDQLHRIGMGRRNDKNIKNYFLEFFYEQKGEYILAKDTEGQGGDSGGPIFILQNEQALLIGIHTGRAIDDNEQPIGYSFIMPITTLKARNWIEEIKSEFLTHPKFVR